MGTSSDSGSRLAIHHILDDAIKSNLVPYQEYFLHGSILDDHVDVLLARLKGLCDDCEGPMESFCDHEICFNISRLQNKPMRMRVRRSLEHKDRPHLLRYLGITETGDSSQPTAVRTSIDVSTSSNAAEFMEGLGFRREFEFLSHGYIFKKGLMKCTVTKIVKTKDNGDTIIAPITNSYLVEMSVVLTAGKQSVGAGMRQFADCLKPLVTMEKTELRF